MRFNVCGILLLTLCLVNCSECSRKCVVVAPRSLRSNSDYTLSLATTGCEEPTKFKIKIYEREAPSANRTLEYVPNDKNLQRDPHDAVTLVGIEAETQRSRAVRVLSTDDKAIITFVRTRTVEVKPNEPRLVTFKIDNDVEPGSYLLEVQSVTGPPFYQKKFLHVAPKTVTIHIQTAKAIYKPGGQVQYRVLVVDADTKPIDVKNALNIRIFDAAHNLVAQALGQSAHNGVYMGEFDIVDDGSLGIWQIEARYKDTKVRKSLECAWYQLPRFQVAVHAPPTIQKSDKSLVVAVEAFYLFGKPVCGSVVVKATPVQNRADFWLVRAEPKVVKGKITGKFLAKFALKDLDKYHITSFLLEVEVQESATGSVRRAFDKTIPVQSDVYEQKKPSALHVKLVGTPRIDHPIKVHVKSHERLESVFYYVVGRGNVLLSAFVHLGSKHHSTFSFNPMFSMAPHSSLVVFYITKDGKLVSTETSLDFGTVGVPSPVKVSVSDKSLKPHQQVSIHVESKPGSYAAFSLIDQSLLLLRKGNDLSIKDVNNDLEQFGDCKDAVLMSDAVGDGTGNDACSRNPQDLDYKSDILDPAVVPWVGKIHKPSHHKDSRVNFLENLWKGSQITNNSLDFTTQVPDSVTSWQLSGISLSPQHGLGVLKRPIVLSTFKPFFVEVILPELAQRHDQVHVHVIVHNYLHWNAKIFVKLDCEGHDVEIVGDNHKHLRVRANRVRATTFTVVPRGLGRLPISVSAFSKHAFDNVVKVMNVEPEGVSVKQYIIKSFILNGTQNFAELIDLRIPATAISGSVKGRIYIQGDKYSLGLQNLENFDTTAPGFGLKLPFGFAAATVNIRQFASTNQLSCGTKETAEATIARAEKTIARYQCADGGFNAEGDCADPDRDTFFTAQNLVVLLSNDAKYLTNKGMLGKTLDYLAGIQREDGTFPEMSTHPVPRSFKDGAGLTSYVVFMFVFNEVLQYVPKSYKVTATKTIDYLLKRLHELDDSSLGFLAIYTNILNHPAKDQVKSLLEGKIYRSRDSAWFTSSFQTDVEVETYAFGVLALVAGGNFNDGLRLTNGLARSLVASFNGRSGINSALTRAALAIANEVYSLPNQAINVTFGATGSNERQTARIENSNKSVLQKFKLPCNTSSIDVQGQGVGYASIQVRYQYNLPEHEIHERFQVQTTLKATGNDKWSLQICTKFLCSEDQAVSNAQLEISLPAGCETDEFIRDEDPHCAKIHKKRFRNNDLVVEFKDMGENEECFVVPIYRKIRYSVQPRVGSVLVFDQEKINYRAKSDFEL